MTDGTAFSLTLVPPESYFVWESAQLQAFKAVLRAKLVESLQTQGAERDLLGLVDLNYKLANKWKNGSYDDLTVPLPTYYDVRFLAKLYGLTNERARDLAPTQESIDSDGNV